MQTSVKTCFKCGRTLPLDEFYAHPQMADGHLNKCKACTRKDTRENRKKNIVYYKLYDRRRASKPERVAQRKQWGEQYKKSGKAFIARKRDKELYPEKHFARCQVAKALRNGTLEKSPCEICGATSAQAHHEDYSKPLDVIWLCPKHHKWIHG